LKFGRGAKGPIYTKIIRILKTEKICFACFKASKMLQKRTKIFGGYNKIRKYGVFPLCLLFIQVFWRIAFLDGKKS
jgi:hypothetical protein